KKMIDISQPGSLDFMDLVRESENEDRLNRHRYFELGDDLFIWKMPRFDLNENEVDNMISKVKKRKGLILDLRGNPGGRVDTLEWLLAHFVDGSVKLADEKGRKETKPLMIKPRANPYKGKVVILIDSRSASAAELFARMAQLEKFGTVTGDRSGGAVMESRRHPLQMGTDTVLLYGVSITSADLIMSDGKSLERNGVAPDEVLLPTPADLAAGRDPVLSRAAAL